MFSRGSKGNIGKERVNVIPTKVSANNDKIHRQNHKKQSSLSQNNGISKQIDGTLRKSTHS